LQSDGQSATGGLVPLSATIDTISINFLNKKKPLLHAVDKGNLIIQYIKVLSSYFDIHERGLLVVFHIIHYQSEIVV
jgi:hypothetical protein